MKKSYLSSVMAALLAVAALSSCDNSILTAGLAEDAVEKDVFWDDPKVTKDISIGYFEINKDDLLPYQQMKAAGLITFTIDKVVEKKHTTTTIIGMAGLHTPQTKTTTSSMCS